MIAGEQTLVRILQFQWGATVLVSVVAGLVSMPAALSALAGGVAYALPNSLFALMLMAKSRMQGANPVSFLLGEGMKIMLSVAILGLINTVLPSVVWPAVVIGLVLVAKSQLAIFIFK
jgi:ATP synthase protein I